MATGFKQWFEADVAGQLAGAFDDMRGGFKLMTWKRIAALYMQGRMQEMQVLLDKQFPAAQQSQVMALFQKHLPNNLTHSTSQIDADPNFQKFVTDRLMPLVSQLKAAPAQQPTPTQAPAAQQPQQFSIKAYLAQIGVKPNEFEVTTATKTPDTLLVRNRLTGEAIAVSTKDTPINIAKQLKQLFL